MKILEQKDEARYKEFLESHNRCNFQQSLEWGKVKTSWKKEVVLSENAEGKIIGSICVWIRKIPVFGNIMYSARGPVCDIHNEEVLKDFHKIMVETGQRDNFGLRSLEYFEKMYDEMAPKHMKLLMAYHENKPIAGIIPIMYGNKVWYLYGASSNSHRNLMPNYLLQWTMIQQAIEAKAEMYDFRGVSGVVDESHPQYGLYRFKKGFNATFTEFIGEVYIPFKPLVYKIYKFSEKLFRTLRSLKRKIKER